MKRTVGMFLIGAGLGLGALTVTLGWGLGVVLTVVAIIGGKVLVDGARVEAAIGR